MQYKNYLDIDHLFKDTKRIVPYGMYKDISYRHEKEYRVLLEVYYRTHSSSIKLSFDPRVLENTISVILHPKASIKDYINTRERLAKFKVTNLEFSKIKLV